MGLAVAVSTRMFDADRAGRRLEVLGGEVAGRRSRGLDTATLPGEAERADVVDLDVDLGEVDSWEPEIDFGEALKVDLSEAEDAEVDMTRGRGILTFPVECV